MTFSVIAHDPSSGLTGMAVDRAHRLFREACARHGDGCREEAVALLRRAQELAPGDELMATWAPRMSG